NLVIEHRGNPREMSVVLRKRPTKRGRAETALELEHMHLVFEIFPEVGKEISGVIRHERKFPSLCSFPCCNGRESARSEIMQRVGSLKLRRGFGKAGKVRKNRPVYLPILSKQGNVRKLIKHHDHDGDGA